MILIALISITFGVIIGLLTSIIKDNSEDMGTWGSILFLVGVFGWGLLGLSFPHIPFKNLHTVTVLTEPTVIHISYNGKIVKTFTDVATYQFLSKTNKTEMLAVGYTNIYGGVHIKDWEFPKAQ